MGNALLAWRRYFSSAQSFIIVATTIPGSPKDGLPAMKIGAGEFVRRIVDSIRGTAASGGAPILTSATATAAWMRSFVEVMQSRRNGTAQDAFVPKDPNARIAP